MQRKLSDLEKDSRTLKMIITTLRRRFNKLDKNIADESFDIETLLRIAESLARIMKVKYDVKKTTGVDERLERLEGIAKLAQRHEMVTN